MMRNPTVQPWFCLATLLCLCAFGALPPCVAAPATRNPQTKTDRADYPQKPGRLQEAIARYLKALEINGKDTAAVMGLAAAYEAVPDLKKAEEFYARALALEPGNARAGARLDEIRFSLLSADQLMADLRDRGAAGGNKPAPGVADIELLKAMRLAERNGAVDYLRSKTAYIKTLVFERREQDRIRLLLTAAGLTSYQKFLSRDAVSFFEKQGIALQEVFTLRDLTGQPVFDKSGVLTPEGTLAYRQGKAGVKSWLMHYEAAVTTPEDAKLNEQIKNLLQRSYLEISEPEYLWLARITTCPDDVLQDPACKMQILRTSKARRYFLFYQDGFPGCNVALNLSLADYRAGETDISETNRGTNFFGTGGNKKHRLCENGKLWQ
jgi:tetratricopeptide (TPR) repeat protein